MTAWCEALSCMLQKCRAGREADKRRKNPVGAYKMDIWIGQKHTHVLNVGGDKMGRNVEAGRRAITYEEKKWLRENTYFGSA